MSLGHRALATDLGKLNGNKATLFGKVTIVPDGLQFRLKTFEGPEITIVLQAQMTEEERGSLVDAVVEASGIVRGMTRIDGAVYQRLPSELFQNFDAELYAESLRLAQQMPGHYITERS